MAETREFVPFPSAVRVWIKQLSWKVPRAGVMNYPYLLNETNNFPLGINYAKSDIDYRITLCWVFFI